MVIWPQFCIVFDQQKMQGYTLYTKQLYILGIINSASELYLKSFQYHFSRTTLLIRSSSLTSAASDHFQKTSYTNIS